MSAIILFKQAWERCQQLSALHTHFSVNISEVLQPDELLRAEWVARVSAMDLFFHELVAETMVLIFEGKVSASKKYVEFKISMKSFDEMRQPDFSSMLVDTQKASAAKYFESEVREYLQNHTLQRPEKISELLKYCTDIDLWQKLAVKNDGLVDSTLKGEIDINKKRQNIREKLTAIIDRRNQISHQSDLQPRNIPYEIERNPWPIKKAELQYVKEFIELLVQSSHEILVDDTNERKVNA
ncbi:MAG: HEPN domain-containing protein [Alphaproteobacteria bacterium]|nr:HEPN domain-containing protein [Alphaproteobacteria bacterium]